MIIKKLFCLAFCFTTLMTVHAQKALYFRPGAGFTFPMEHLIHKDIHPSFRYNNHNFYMGGGIEAFYRANDKVDIYAGYQSSTVDFSYRIHNSRYSSGISLMEFPLGVEWLIKDVWFHPMDKRPALFRRNSREYGYFFLALFRIRALTGISMSLLQHEESSKTVNHPHYTFSENIHQLQRRNFSVFGGLTIQFYNQNRDKLHFTLLYNQGIRKILEMEMEEIANGETFTARLGSRGSYFATQLRIPLRLVTFN